MRTFVFRLLVLTMVVASASLLPDVTVAGTGQPIWNADRLAEQDDSTHDPATEAKVFFWILECPGVQAAIRVHGPLYAADPGPDCSAEDQPQVVLITDAAGNESQVPITSQATRWLPFGDYRFTDPTTGLSTTAAIVPNDTYRGVCMSGGDCPMMWLVAISHDMNSAGSRSGPAGVSDAEYEITLESAIERFGGDWTGTFYQSNPSGQWTIDLSFWGNDYGKVGGSIVYHGLGCSGDLIMMTLILDFGLNLREDITKGEEVCIDGGQFNIESTGDELLFTWMKQGSQTTGHGTLHRVGAPPVQTGALGSLEVHAVQCPPGYRGPDYYGVCHDNGAFGSTFLLFGPEGTLRIQTTMEGAVGPAVGRTDGLPPAMYTLEFNSKFTTAPAFVFCSPDQGETELVSQELPQGGSVEVPIEGQAVVCDWYFYS